MCNALTAAFDDQPRQFFYEQWYTARTLDERPHYVVGKRGAYRDSRNHFLDLALRKPIEGNLSVMRSHRPGRAKLWPRGVASIMGAVAVCSTRTFCSSRLEGSLQCKSSKAITIGWALAVPIAQSASVASKRCRCSSTPPSTAGYSFGTGTLRIDEIRERPARVSARRLQPNDQAFWRAPQGRLRCLTRANGAAYRRLRRTGSSG